MFFGYELPKIILEFLETNVISYLNSLFFRKSETLSIESSVIEINCTFLSEYLLTNLFKPGIYFLQGAHQTAHQLITIVLSLKLSKLNFSPLISVSSIDGNVFPFASGLSIVKTDSESVKVV